jgi:predicted RNase H-like HicB family nuclease
MKITINNFPVHVKHDKETGLYIGIFPGIIGAHNQAATLNELILNLEEVLEICLEERNVRKENLA